MLRRCLTVVVVVVIGLVLANCSALFNDDPIAAFSWSPQPVDAGTEVTFSSTSTDSDGNIISWEWTFGDGTRGSGHLAPHTFVDDGVYTVTLTVTDNCGATNSVSRLVSISNPEPVIGRMTVKDLDRCGSCVYSICHRIEATLENVVDVAGIEPKRVVSASIDFGDGAGSVFSGFSAIYVYKWAGDYTITGTVIDDDGAMTSVRRKVRIKYYPPLKPVVQLRPSPRCVDLGERICFYVHAYDREECAPCPWPCDPPCEYFDPCPSPCDPPCLRTDPCAVDGVTLQNYEASNLVASPLNLFDYETMSHYGPNNGIVRIRVVVIDPNGRCRAYDTCNECSGNLSLSDPRFCVNFNICGRWEIKFVAYDDDGQSTGYVHKVNVS